MNKHCSLTGHIHEVSKKHHVVEQIDQNYLAEKVEEHCREIMQRFFPEVA